MEHHEVALREQVSLSIQELEDSFAIAVRQRELLENYIKERLTPGKHFYKVPGSKNSLTKEGAELICLPHGYRPRYVKEGGPDQPPQDGSPYQITVRCQLAKGEAFAGEGLGSASSYHTTRSGEYNPRQRDPGLCHNATLKMAQKSAYIAATLNATAASEFFTQDLEDGAEVHDVPEQKLDAHWCVEHNAAWFKRGRMRGYAHPIGETGEWCNESEQQDYQVPARAEPIIGNLGDFMTWATETYGYTRSSAICTDMGVEKPVQILQMHKTWDVAVAYLTAKHAPQAPEPAEGDDSDTL